MNVVVADDERIVRQGVRMVCEQSGLGLTVHEACQGFEVLELVSRHAADILVLDIRMPQMDGLETLRRMHEAALKPECIVISGYDDFTYAKTCIRYGVVDYLLKPAGATEILDSLTRCLQRVQERSLAAVQQVDMSDSPPSPLSEVMEYIGQHLHDRISLVTAANYVHISPTYLAALFRQKTGQTFLDYVTARKIELACQLLHRGLRIHEIAEQLGYGEARYFGQVFKRVTGMTPREYRMKVH